MKLWEGLKVEKVWEGLIQINSDTGGTEYGTEHGKEHGTWDRTWEGTWDMGQNMGQAQEGHNMENMEWKGT